MFLLRVVPLLLLLSTLPVAGQAGASDFRFSPGDRVRVSVWPDSSLSGEFPIESSGTVHLPLLGPVAASGKTVDLLREEIRVGYQRDLQLPVVSLEALFRVSVLGGVRAPGVFWVDPSFGVFEALSMAGGLTERAKEDRIIITRADGQSFLVDAARFNVQGSTEALLRMRSGDRLMVEEGGSFNWGFVLQALTLVVSVTSVVVSR